MRSAFVILFLLCVPILYSQTPPAVVEETPAKITKPDVLIFIQPEPSGGETIVITYQNKVIPQNQLKEDLTLLATELNTELKNVAMNEEEIVNRSNPDKKFKQTMAQFQSVGVVNYAHGTVNFNAIAKAFIRYEKLDVTIISPNMIYNGPIGYDDKFVGLSSIGSMGYRITLKTKNPKEINIPLFRPLPTDTPAPKKSTPWVTFGLIILGGAIVAVSVGFLVYYLYNKPAKQ